MIVVLYTCFYRGVSAVPARGRSRYAQLSRAHAVWPCKGCNSCFANRVFTLWHQCM